MTTDTGRAHNDGAAPSMAAQTFEGRPLPTRPSRRRAERSEHGPGQPERDMVFADGVEHQLGTMSGSVADGLTVGLAVPVRA
jgi:hypothetical protein